MGCVFVKGISSEEKADEVRKKLSSRRNSGTTSLPADKKGRLVGKETKSANLTVDHQSQVNLRIASVPDSFKAESLNAGWPSWLASVAGEAIKGWVPRKAGSFEKLDKIGQGTYSSVFKARDLETGATVALKRVRFASTDPESVRFMAREIIVLRSLDHINVIKLEGLITSRSSNSLYLVLEYMEHDLGGLVATPSIRFSEPQVKCYMQQLLRGLEHCHSRGVLHRDIKGSNLLIDNNGILKLADFGLAAFYNPHQERRPSTNRVVTLWYRPPELLLGCTKYDVGVDLWSSGCVLGEILSGKPIMPGRTEVEQLHKIFKLCGSPSLEYWQRSKHSRATLFKSSHHYRRCIKDTFKDSSSSTLALLDTLLAIEPAKRGTSSSALVSEFFNTEPYACHPSSLPKYPPTKELDVRCRDEEEARRQEAESLKGHESRSMKLEQYYGKQNHRSSIEKYRPQEDGFPRNGTVQTGSSWRRNMSIGDGENVSFRSLDNKRVSNATGLKKERSYMHRGNDSNFSGSIAMPSSVKSYNQEGRRNSQRSEHRHTYDQCGDDLSSHKNEKRGLVKEATSGGDPSQPRNEVLEIATSSLSSLARLPWGSTSLAGTTENREYLEKPPELLQLFEFEACPFCRRVREAMTELDLSIEVYPCPKGSIRHREVAKKIGGKEMFPLLVDPNTGVSMYESGDIVKYLFIKYGHGRKPTFGLLESTLFTGWMPTLLRAGRGMTLWDKARRELPPPSEKLELFSYENNPYARIVREALCELELPYILHNAGKGSSRYELLVKSSGSDEVPYLIDPNTGVRIGDYKTIVSYLFETYSTGN